MNETKSYESTLNQLNTSLEATEKDIDSFIVDSTGNTPKANLLDRLTVLENKLKTIDSAKSYIKALLVVKELWYAQIHQKRICKLSLCNSSQALNLVQTEPETAIIPYTQLVKFEKYISDEAEQHEQYNALSKHLQKSRIRLNEELDAVLALNFKQTLDGLSWPTPIKPPYGPQIKTKLKGFEKAFRNLLMLQKS